MRYKILNKEEVFSEFFQIELAELKHEKFNSSEWCHIKRYSIKRPAAAAVLIENPVSDRIVLTEQFRYSSLIKTVRDGWSLEIPAGLLEKGEEPETCVQREALEETGYKLRELKHLTTYFSSVGLSDELLHLYYAQVDADDKVASGGGVEKENEDIKVVEIPFAEAFALIDKGEITDGKTIVALQWMALRKMSRGGFPQVPK